MRASKWIRVRPLDVSDFRFVRQLASKQDNFTVPPLFVLWLLKQANGRSCLVADHVKFGPVAYLLSLPVSKPGRKALYVWQLAASASGQRVGAIEMLLLELRAFVRRMRIRSLVFTAVPNSPEFRAIRRYAYTLSAGRPQPLQQLPPTVSQTEHEFTIKVR